jgi:hypothetical protein
MSFQVDYRFTEGAPGLGGALRYAWVIRTARGQTLKRTLTPARLRPQGTLRGRTLGAV